MANLEFYFARKDVPRTENDLADYYFDVWQTSQSLRAHQLKDKWERYTHSCVSFLGKCAYFDACSGMGSLEDPNLFRKVENVHQELKKAV
jgi:hypothetical protein